jgi:hypothetical protein
MIKKKSLKSNTEAVYFNDSKMFLPSKIQIENLHYNPYASTSNGKIDKSTVLLARDGHFQAGNSANNIYKRDNLFFFY